ncbi:hypothetical protein N7533_006012 [Penicillium manginii]|uniref:uncharacterized protein n=1 Tax=Penicillium manginii TaxID=203109 RepID=UPI0025498D0E|nr:uncharacterized protein N7533_006012 [Penicillium manginii]KAJ5756469.1 hypothetical protein N7533_006012 [Penicillium manginii]
MTLKSAKAQRLEVLFSALAGRIGPIGSASFLSNHLPDTTLSFTPDITEKPETTICERYINYVISSRTTH